MNNISISKKINKYNISDNPLLLSVSPNAVQPGLPATPEAFLESQKNIKNSNPILWLIKQKYEYNNQLSDLEHNLIQKTFSKDDNSNNNVCIKDIKNNLFNIENKLFVYFKKPYMRKNVKIKKNIVIKNKFEEEEQVEDEDKKIKFDENDIKMEDIKDDDSKTNNDSCEEINTDYDKRKNP